jgi:hypothetical protein
MAISTLKRDFDLARIIADYKHRIETLERRFLSFGFLTPEFVDAQGCRLTRTAVQSCNNATQTIVNFDAEISDNNAMHSTVTNNSRITINVAGLYVAGFSGEFATAADYQRVMASILLNGATVIARDQIPGTVTNAPARPTATTVRHFDAGDYIEAQAFHQNGAATARNLTLNTEYSPIFYAARIGSN